MVEFIDFRLPLNEILIKVVKTKLMDHGRREGALLSFGALARLTE